MLRGRCSCAISERSTASFFALPLLSCPLTPLFPLDASHSPVSPLFPLHTQKQGGTPLLWYDQSFHFGVFLNPVFPLRFPCLPSLPCALRVRRLSRPGRDGASSFRRFPLLAPRHSPPSSVIPGGSNRLENLAPNCKLSAVNCRLSPLSPIILAPLATAALRVVPSPIVTTTSRIHVGAPTILFRERTTASQQFPDRRAMLSSNCVLLAVDCELLFSPNSNHSRTYEPPSRKSNYSRTYAKQGGGVS